MTPAQAHRLAARVYLRDAFADGASDGYAAGCQYHLGGRLSDWRRIAAEHVAPELSREEHDSLVALAKRHMAEADRLTEATPAMARAQERRVNAWLGGRAI